MLAELINYTKVADSRLITVFENHPNLPEKALSLFNHVLNAQHIWATRILGQAPNFAVWAVHQPSELAAIAEANHQLLQQILENVPLAQTINYQNTQGEYSNVVKDILFHVVNHSTYHRAQIASILKSVGIEPPVTDYIILKRENQL